MDTFTKFAERSAAETLEEKRLIRKIHWRIIPIFSLFYGLVFLNRTNISVITQFNLKTQSSHTQNIITNAKLLGIIFGVGFGPPEFFTNVVLLHLKPRIWLFAVIGLTGLFGAISGAVNTFEALIVVRFFLAIVEGAFFPGAIYLISRWYRRDYLGLPVAIYYSGAAVLAAFGNLIAAGIVNIKSKKEGWQWISIIEGCMTIALVLIAIWMPNPPEVAETHRPDILTTENASSSQTSMELETSYTPAATPVPGIRTDVNLDLARNDDEPTVIQKRHTRHEFLSTEEKITFDNWITRDDPFKGIPESLRSNRYWKCALTDPKTYLYAFMMITGVVPRDLSVQLLPGFVGKLVKKDLDPSYQMLLTVPPLFCAFLFTVFAGWISDVTKKRGYVNIFCSSLMIIGGTILLATNNPKSQYIAAFFVCMGSFSTAANEFTWVCNNIEGYRKRAIVLGILLGCRNTVGISVPGTTGKTTARFAMILGSAVLSMLASVIVHLYLRRENGRKQYKLNNGHPRREANSGDRDDEGDMGPEFLYYE